MQFAVGDKVKFMIDNGWWEEGVILECFTNCYLVKTAMGDKVVSDITMRKVYP